MKGNKGLHSNMAKVLKNTESKYKYNIKGVSKKDDLRRLSERVTKLEQQLKKIKISNKPKVIRVRRRRNIKAQGQL